MGRLSLPAVVLVLVSVTQELELQAEVQALLQAVGLPVVQVSFHLAVVYRRASRSLTSADFALGNTTPNNSGGNSIGAVPFLAGIKRTLGTLDEVSKITRVNNKQGGTPCDEHQRLYDEYDIADVPLDIGISLPYRDIEPTSNTTGLGSNCLVCGFTIATTVLC